MTPSRWDHVRMSAPPRRVFLSHTSELRTYPRPTSFIDAVESAVKRAGDAIVDMAYFTSADRLPSELCRERVESSDIYIAAIGFKYGSPVREDPSISYTEMEFNAATTAGIPRLVFLLSETAEIPRSISFDPKFESRQQRFRSRILDDSGLTVQRFVEARQLETLAMQALLAVPGRRDSLSRRRSSRKSGGPVGLEDTWSGSSRASHISRYRQVMRQASRYLTPPNTDNTSRVVLQKLYVLPSLHGRIEPPDRDREIDLLEILEKARRVVFVGDPGGGKTTLTTKLMYEFCRSPKTENATIPFLVILREYSASREGSPTSIIEFISSTLNMKYQLNVPGPAIESLLETENVVVIFDGLDELLDPRSRQDMAASIEAFSEIYPRARVLVTSRRVGYLQAPLAEDIFSIVSLHGFDDQQVSVYVKNWFALDSRFSEVECKALSDGFIRESRLVADLTRNPLMLALMCSIYKTESYIPRNRPDVYEKCSRMLFDRWDRHRGLKRPLAFEAHVEPAMMDLAFWIYSTPELQSGVPERLLVDRAASYLQTWQYESYPEALQAAREFIEFCRGRAWVFTDVGLTPDGESLYQFTHRTFLEYFSACHMAITNDESDLLDLLGEKIVSAEWDVVAQLAIQMKSRQRLGGADRAVSSIVKLYEGASSVGEKFNVASFLARSLAFLVPSPAVVRSAVELVVEAHLTAYSNRKMLPVERSNERLIPILSSVAREMRGQVMKVIYEELLAVSEGDLDSERREVATSVLCHLDNHLGENDQWSKWAETVRTELLAKSSEFPKAWLWVASMRLFNGLIDISEYLALTGKNGITYEANNPGTNTGYTSPLTWVMNGLLGTLSESSQSFVEMGVAIGEVLAADSSEVRSAEVIHLYSDVHAVSQGAATISQEVPTEQRPALLRVLAVTCEISRTLDRLNERGVSEQALLDRQNLGILEFSRPFLEHRDDWLIVPGLAGTTVWEWAKNLVSRPPNNGNAVEG